MSGHPRFYDGFVRFCSIKVRYETSFILLLLCVTASTPVNEIPLTGSTPPHWKRTTLLDGSSRFRPRFPDTVLSRTTTKPRYLVSGTPTSHPRPRLNSFTPASPASSVHYTPERPGSHPTPKIRFLSPRNIPTFMSSLYTLRENSSKDQTFSTDDN